MNIEKQLAIIKRGVSEIIGEQQLREHLAAGKKLRVKLGIDPTASDLHLGHTVVLHKLRQLQDLGHHIQFLIGDFTAAIGDPSGKNITRQPLSRKQIQINTQTFKTQITKLLDPKKTDILFNSAWLAPLSATEMIKLTAQSTVARMLERDDFHKRYQNKRSIAIHEFLYPLLQGYDSVVMHTDMELGGSDQKFNLLMGRELQKNAGQTPQILLMMPLLEGLDGVKKMSKSLNNTVGIDEKPAEMFGKLMSISDKLMWRYYALLSLQSLEKIQQDQQEAKHRGIICRDAKLALAEELVGRFYNQQQAQAARVQFLNRFQAQRLPDDIVELKLQPENEHTLKITHILKWAKLCKSNSEACRMIQQAAVKINQRKINDPQLNLSPGKRYIVQVGKRKIVAITIVAINKI